MKPSGLFAFDSFAILDFGNGPPTLDGGNGFENFFRPKSARHFRDLAAYSRPRVLQFGSSLVYLSKFLSNKI